MLSVEVVLKRAIEQDNYNGEPFFIVDLKTVDNLYQKWRANLPRVDPFYAVKCNSDKELLNAVNRLNVGFDCASKAEISRVLAMGTDPSSIIFANPIKPKHHIRFAREKGVKKMTFDNGSELFKVRDEFPDAELVLRIAANDAKSAHRFSFKFGAALSSVEELLYTARLLRLNVVGVSFHVGSGCGDAMQYYDAVKSARFVFDKALEFDFNLNILDIGGGFPGQEDVEISFESIAEVVNKSLEQFFSTDEFPHLRIIAEPGRFFSCSAFTLAASVISRHVLSAEKPKKFMYFISDGVFGSFNGVLTDPAASFRPEVATQRGKFVMQESSDESLGELYNCKLWGPSMDSADCLLKDARLPELEIGDWVIFRNMGSYSTDLSTTFNGFPHARRIYINGAAWSSCESASTAEKASMYLAVFINKTLIVFVAFSLFIAAMCRMYLPHW